MRAILVLMVVLAPGWAVGAGVDTPQGAARPTLHSEIRRGADAAFGCQIEGADRPLDAEALLRCLVDKQSGNRRQMDRGYEPFEAGLWYTGLGRLRALSSVAPGEVRRSNIDVAAAGLRQAEQDCGMTDAEVWRALHPQARDPSATRLLCGAAHVPAKAHR